MDVVLLYDFVILQSCYRVRRQPKAGFVIIIANENFHKKPMRKGTKFDITNVKTLFKQLDFEVKEFNDLPADVWLNYYIFLYEINATQFLLHRALC